MSMKKIRWPRLALWIIGIEGVGMLGGMLAGMDNIRRGLTSWSLPTFMPSSWVFGVVWPVLYLLMAVAAYLIWEKTKPMQRKSVFLLFWLQLLLDFIWPSVFFRFELLYLSAFIILGMIISTALCMLKFSKDDPNTAYLLLPYLIWIIFALSLNISIAMRNG